MMEMLKSEVKLLLLRNSQLENENLMLKQNEMRLNKHLYREKRLNKVLETIKVAQNEYISRLNMLIVDLTTDSADNHTYNQLKQQITSCVKTCRTLQTEYEMCKQTLFAAKVCPLGCQTRFGLLLAVAIAPNVAFAQS